MLLVDATTAEQAAGIRVVIEGFLGGLAELPQREDVVVAAGASLRLPPGLHSVRVSLAGSTPGRIAYQRLLMPWHIRRLKHGGQAIDHVLLPDVYMPVLATGGQAYTVFVHDLLALTHSHYWTASQRLIKRLAFDTVRKSKASLVTSTEHNAVEIEARLGRSAAIAHFGCGQLTDAEADAALTENERPRTPHFLFVGTIQRRKGLTTLVDAFAQALPSLGDETKLLIVGKYVDGTEALLRREIQEKKIAHRVQLLGWKNRKDTLDLVRTSRALVFPSEAEGFGIPVLEGLALRTPVITSNIEAIRSWAGDSVVYAAPNECASLEQALVSVAKGEHPPVERGLALSRSYRWRRFAEDLLQVAMDTSITSAAAAHS